MLLNFGWMFKRICDNLTQNCFIMYMQAAQKLLDEPAYKLEDPFEVDYTEERVQLGFECVMATKPGRGTDFICVDADKLVCKIHAVRHWKCFFIES